VRRSGPLILAETVVDRVSEPLATHGVHLDTASVIPSDLEGAELVIITPMAAWCLATGTFRSCETMPT
jgi:hypothetical protein